MIRDYPKLVKAPSWKGRSHQVPAKTVTDQFYDLLLNVVADETHYMFSGLKCEWMNQWMNITHMPKNTISKSQNKSSCREKITSWLLIIRDEKDERWKEVIWFSSLSTWVQVLKIRKSNKCKTLSSVLWPRKKFLYAQAKQ